MGEPVSISLGMRSNPARNAQASSCRLVNCYAEELGEDGKTTWALYGTPGNRNFGAELNEGPVRALLEVDEALYAVSGRDVFVVNAAGVSTRIGGIATDGSVYWDRNRKIPPQIGLVSSGFYYVADTTAGSVTEILDPDLPSPISFSTIDGYGVLPVVNREFAITGIDEFTTIDGLDIGTVETYPDEIVRSMVLERELVFFKQKSIEWHTNSGDPDFPFTRVHAIELGCLAADSVAKVDTDSRKTLIWVAPDHTVRMMNGYSGSVISTNELHKLIKALHDTGNITQLKGRAWADDGNFFYALSCNTWTRVWNAKTGNWHHQESYGISRWRIGEICTFGNKLIGGDYETGQLYEIRSDLHEESGQPMIARVIPPTVSAFPYNLIFNQLFIDAARGVGVNSTEDHIADPKIMVRWSDDAGSTWSAHRERSLGRLGQQAKRIKPIRRMGRSKDTGRLFEFSISAPVERVMLQISLDFDRLEA